MIPATVRASRTAKPSAATTARPTTLHPTTLQKFLTRDLQKLLGVPSSDCDSLHHRWECIVLRSRA